jgi:hypothetical protein
MLGQWWRAVALTFHGELQWSLARSGLRVRECRRLRPLGALIGEGKVQTRGARNTAASPRSVGQASDRSRGLAQSGHFQMLIGSRSSCNSPKSLHTICSLSFTLCFSYSTQVDLISESWDTRGRSWVCRSDENRDLSRVNMCQTVFVWFQTLPEYVQGNLAPHSYLGFVDLSFGK